MGKTRTPHVESFQAFACWVDEYYHAVDRSIPAWLDEPDIINDQSAEGRAARKDFEWRRQELERALLELERHRISELGLSKEQIEDPMFQAYLVENMQRAMALMAVRQASRPTPKVSLDLEEEWKPRRETSVRIIVGTHLAFSGGNRVVTARRLNRGIPRGQGAYQISPFEVRNALDSFVRRHVSSTDRLELAAVVLVSNAQFIEAIWARVQACRAKRIVPLYRLAFELVESGQLLDWRAEYKASGIPTHLEEPIMNELLTRTIRLLEAEYGKRMRHAA